MCGIAGILNLKARSAPEAEPIARMVSALRHRGPDGSGIYLDDRIALGHARLSIIDLAGGSQPIHNEDDTLWIVYNGEVFNYPELRQGLLARGHRFATATDTEVILHLFEEKGPGCLQDLNGQFAFAIWDSRKEELFLARDRVGILPLNYSLANGNLVFASEIKAIFALPEIPRALDPLVLDQIFTFWAPLPGRTVFCGINELPPGHYLTVKDGRVETRKYWDLAFRLPGEAQQHSEEEAAHSVHELVKDAVRIRLRADVPVGSYLSGGLDSSAITAMVRRHFNNELRTFGIRFEDKVFDEGEFQHQMVSFLGTKHTEMLAGNDQIGASFPDVVWHCERPLLRTAPTPLFLLAGAVRENGFKVVLTGEGADEVFGGYDIFRETKIRKFWARQPRSAFRPLLLGRLYPDVFQGNKRVRPFLHSFFGHGLDRADDPFFSHLVRWENTKKTKIFFSRETQAAVGDYSCYHELRGNLPESFQAWDTLARAQYLETAIFLSNYLLSAQGDRMAMAHGVEMRPPYLDHRIIEFMGRIPSKLKIKVLNEKYLLKKAFHDLLPESIVARSKHPYRAPIKSSLLGSANTWAWDMLTEESLRHCGIFDAEKVAFLVKKMRGATSAGEFDSMALCGILSTQLIHKQFIEHDPGERLRTVSQALVIDRRSRRSTVPASIGSASR